MKSSSAFSKASDEPPRLACMASAVTLLLRLPVNLPPASRSPVTETAASNACPEADCDGGKMTVLVLARIPNNSFAAAQREALKYSKIRSRFSSRTTTSVIGFVARARLLANQEGAGMFGGVLSTAERRVSRSGSNPVRAARKIICAAPEWPSRTSETPRSTSVGVPRPAASRAAPSTARRCTGTSKPTASAIPPRTAHAQNQDHRFIASPFLQTPTLRATSVSSRVKSIGNAPKHRMSRNPKLEIRSPNEIRSPKRRSGSYLLFGLRVSDFFRISTFEFRIYRIRSASQLLRGFARWFGNPKVEGQNAGLAPARAIAYKQGEPN